MEDTRAILWGFQDLLGRYVNAGSGDNDGGGVNLLEGQVWVHAGKNFIFVSNIIVIVFLFLFLFPK